MKLSEIIRNYRNDNDLSQREFAKRCGLSNSYISFIEKENNPKTGRPLTPTIEQYKKIADAMGMSLHSLFLKLDVNSPVILSSVFPDDIPQDPLNYRYPVIDNYEEFRLISAFRKADDHARQDALMILESHPVKE